MQIKIDPDTWYDVTETSSMLGCKPTTLENYRIKGGGPPYSKLGRRVFYKGEDLMAYIERNRRKSTVDLPELREPRKLEVIGSASDGGRS